MRAAGSALLWKYIHIYHVNQAHAGAECIAVLIQTDCTKHDGNGPVGLQCGSLCLAFDVRTKFRKGIGADMCCILAPRINNSQKFCNKNSIKNILKIF